MRILFDSKKEYYKSPFGCLRQNEMCKLRIEIPQSCKTVLVKTKIFSEDGFEMIFPMNRTNEHDGYEVYTGEFSLYAPGLYFYFFSVQTEGSAFDLYKQGNDTNMGEGDLWQLTCFDKNYDTPNCFKGKVMYQIFPDRFAKNGICDAKGKLEPYVLHNSDDDIPVFEPDQQGKIINNDFYGGNLCGITQKLPYLKELGVGVIYLNPIFYAYSNHRYDTADYKRIDPLLGTEADFVKLCNAAHKNGIKVILDGVFSHTGSNSIYFDKEKIFGNGALSNENSPYRGWYMFQNYPKQYTSWWGIDTLPCVDEMNKSYMDYIIYSEDSVVAHWLGLGADGFRLDVADELPDEFILAFKTRMKQINPDALLIGEVWEDASNKISYGKRRRYFSASELDSVMNYPFRTAILDFIKGRISGYDFADRVMNIVENYPLPVLQCNMNSLSTHDTCRVLTEISDAKASSDKGERARFRLSGEEKSRAISLEMAAALLQFTLPGNPCIYYGDEIGMEGYEDPLNRGFFRWADVECDLHRFYKSLSLVKNENEALRLGIIVFYTVDDRRIVFSRKLENTEVMVELNLKGDAVNASNTLLSFSRDNISAAVYLKDRVEGNI